MFDEELKRTWSRAGATAPALGPHEIEALLRPSVRDSRRAFAWLARNLLGLLGLTALCACANLYGYRHDPLWLGVQGALALVALSGMALVLRFLSALRESEPGDRPLLELVERRLELHRRTYGPGLVLYALTPWLLTLAVTTCLENEGGHYTLHHPLEFAGVSLFMVALTYALVRRSTHALASELEALLHDLRADALEETLAIPAAKARARLWTIAGAAFVALLLLLTLYLWWRT